jgi:uncharacterized OB-fold protein
MAKQQTFADKATKLALHGAKCDKCGQLKVPTLIVASEKAPGGTMKYTQRRVQVCKCNEKEVYA